MRVGSLVFATSQGLGILAKSFYDNGIITHPLVIRHGRRPENDDWFPGAPRIADLRRQRDEIMRHCAECDVVLFLETPFLDELLPYCRERGIPTVWMPMHECMPKQIPHQPDLWLCPSDLDLKWAYRQLPVGTKTEAMFLPVPVDVPWKQRTRAEVFVHNAGNGGLKGRNGTKELLEALWLCNCMKGSGDASFIIRSQEPLPDVGPRGDLGGRIKWISGTVPYESLYSEGDCLVFPERFNGLSLPLQEARAAGMLVMATDRFPMNTWLPRVVETTTAENKTFRTHSNPLIPVSGYKRSCVSPRCHEFEEAITDPRDIARTIDAWYGADITEYSRAGREWARSMSWEVLGPKYREVLEGLCRTTT